MVLDKLKARFGEAITAAETSHGQEIITIAREGALDIFHALRTEGDFGFDALIDVTAVDWMGREPRFDLVYQLKSLKLGHRLRVKIPVGGEEPWVNSLVGEWKSADWLERECYDMFGIDFRGHSDLRRILLYDSFVGHPLRKDYPYNRRQPLVPEVDPIATPRPPSR